ncbi:MAG: hypothetical protein J1E36_05340 [Eubacterium sp.]|nr:hypothetical protein [Eubacterium sp.]
MKRKDVLLLIILSGVAGVLIIFSADARAGALEGLKLSQNTIIPSLTPLLIIFFIIMKTNAKDVIARAFGFISTYVFNLPQVTFPAILFGLIGGYPTGALLTNELLLKGEIDEKQAQRLLRFNFCGGCGFIITAVGSASLSSTKAGVILFLSSVISSVIVGVILSFSEKRKLQGYYSYTEEKSFGDALTTATDSAVKSVLNITAFIILFSAINKILTIPQQIMPFIEITSGACGEASYPLAQLSAYLSFGGVCIHFQLLPVITRAKMKYYDFLFFRILSGLLSYCVTKLLLVISPMDVSVFSNASIGVAEFSSVNIALSVLMIIGCFVIIMDISSKKKVI